MSALRAARTNVEARIESLSRSFDEVVASSEADAADDEHDPDGSGGVAYERQQVVALLRAARAELAELDAAEARVRAGTYGACERCASDIPAERLEAMPAVRTCISCAV